MRKNAINVVLGVFVAVAFGLAGCGGDGGFTPSTKTANVVGTWKTGTLTITIASNGSYTTVDNVNGVNVTGTYTTNGNQLILNDTGGTGSCTGNQATGTYTYTVAGGGTTFALTKISDSCTNREKALNGLTFILVTSDGGNVTNAEVFMLRMNNNPDVNGTPDYKYFVESYIDDPNHVISSASLTGMGNTSAYAYNSSTKKWWDDSGSRYSTKSPVFPMNYTIFITYKDGHNSTLARTVSSWSIAQ
ncbi:MAG: hypothetical protein Q8O92_09440 [Candidatus Latescibacter sp.]|nr:hypothetical protein [Candidatus Latescibacter sp.]